MKHIFFSTVLNGQLPAINKTFFREILSSFEGREVQMTLERKRNNRSLKQNKYWWCIMQILSHETGFTKDEMHAICKMKFLKREKVNPKTGEVLEYVGSTAKLTTKEFGELVDNLVRWAAEDLNCYLPEPSEQMTIEI